MLGKKMKNGEKGKSFALCFFALALALCALVFSVNGCRYPVKAYDFVDDAVEDVAFAGSGEEFALPGETEAQRRRKWARIKRISRQQLMSDIDTALLTDKPSKLSGMRVP